jgi:chemotaxis protein MotB
MSRRKTKAAAHNNHERWLVSYADFVTLLFAFFVVMFASSQTDHGSALKISESVKKALVENQVAAALANILGGTVDDKGKGNAMMRGPGGANRIQPTAKDSNITKFAELLPAQSFLDEELKNEIKTGKVKVSMEARGLVVTLRESAFFPPGDDAVDPGARPTIQKIAGLLGTLPNQVRLEGHTDSVPIHNQRFRSNWELSAARAIAMLVMFENDFGIPRGKFAIGGYADSAPVDTNETAEGRGRNRRVDVVILNKGGMTSEPSIGKPGPSPPAPSAAGTRR